MDDGAENTDSVWRARPEDGPGDFSIPTIGTYGLLIDIAVNQGIINCQRYIISHRSLSGDFSTKRLLKITERSDRSWTCLGASNANSQPQVRDDRLSTGAGCIQTCITETSN